MSATGPKLLLNFPAFAHKLPQLHKCPDYIFYYLGLDILVSFSTSLKGSTSFLNRCLKWRKTDRNSGDRLPPHRSASIFSEKSRFLHFHFYTWGFKINIFIKVSILQAVTSGSTIYQADKWNSRVT